MRFINCLRHQCCHVPPKPGWSGAKADGSGVKAATLVVWLCLLGVTCAAEDLKVVCASRAETPPMIDGALDEPCWQKAEVRSDFTSPGSGQVLSRRTTMRVLYDQDHLYFGFEVFWDSAALLNKGVAEIKGRYPEIKEGVWLKEWKYENTHGLELFLDPGASGRNYYQMLFNAAGQCIGNYKCLFECFNIQPVVKGAIQGNCWSVEMAYPAKNLKIGQEWGLNVCRNDETYYGIWKQVQGAYHNPKLFGRLVIGDYREWWEAAGGKEVRAQLEALRSQSARYAKRDNRFSAMVDQVAGEMDVMGKWAGQYPPVGRASFEQLYERYAGCRDKQARLQAYRETLELLTRLR